MKRIHFLFALAIFISFINSINFAYSQTISQIKINVVYVSGDVKINNQIAKLNQQVLVNQKIQTGNDGHIYLKSADNGFLVLRPNSVAFIRAYTVDSKNPQNNRIKIELENGVARHISGEAVKSSRQNFRFNTPVAAIGVRGTDFVVLTDINASRIAVNSGGIAISPFNKTCQAEAFGACQGKSVMELFADLEQKNTNINKILEVSANDKIPRLLENINDTRLQTNPQENQNIENAIIDSNQIQIESKTEIQNNNNEAAATTEAIETTTTTTNNVETSATENTTESTEKATEKTAENTTENTTEKIESASADIKENTKKNNQNLVENSQTPDAENTKNLEPAKVENAIETVVLKDIHWGRWKAIADKPTQIDLNEINGNDIDFINNNAYFTVFRDKGEWQRPLNDLQFVLTNSEAIVREKNGKLSDATLKNGYLNVDIAAQKFTTGFDAEYRLSNKNQLQKQNFYSNGNVSDKGVLGSVIGRNGNINTSGVLSHDNSGAAYIFSGNGNDRSQIYGVTQWGIKK